MLIYFFSFNSMDFNPTLALHSIQALVIYGGIVIAFLGGIIWGWEESLPHQQPLDCNWVLSFGLRSSISFFYKFITQPYLMILVLQVFLNFEKKNSSYFQANIKYANARNLITNLVTICCITSLAFLYNPYT